jgi:hypothetical protein
MRQPHYSEIRLRIQNENWMNLLPLVSKRELGFAVIGLIALNDLELHITPLHQHQAYFVSSTSRIEEGTVAETSAAVPRGNDFSNKPDPLEELSCRHFRIGGRSFYRKVVSCHRLRIGWNDEDDRSTIGRSRNFGAKYGTRRNPKKAVGSDKPALTTFWITDRFLVQIGWYDGRTTPVV